MTSRLRFTAWRDPRLVPLAGAYCVLALALSARAEAPSPDQFKPKWKIGQRWQVESVCQQTQARHAPKAGRANKPVRWQFEVQRREKVDGRECFRVRVTCLAPGRQPETTLWVDQQTMTLVQVQAQLPTAMGFRTLKETYRSASGQPFPAFAPLTVPPLELPLFLVGTKGSQTFDYEASSGTGTEKAVGDIAFAFHVEQNVTRPSENTIKSLLPDRYAKSLREKPTIEVRLKAAHSRVRQLWQVGLPWPAYSDNGVTRCWLIRGTGDSN